MYYDVHMYDEDIHGWSLEDSKSTTTNSLSFTRSKSTEEGESVLQPWDLLFAPCVCAKPIANSPWTVLMSGMFLLPLMCHCGYLSICLTTYLPTYLSIYLSIYVCVDSYLCAGKSFLSCLFAPL
jgi:hypothetical protein